MISNIEYYRTFYYVANMESFSLAAEQLHLTQSAVSQSIRKLESELSCQLFVRNRNTKKTLLTEEGQQLYNFVQNAFLELQKGENAIKNLIIHRKKEVTIGATETAIRFFLPTYLKSWESSHPDTRLNLVGSTTGELCEMLLNNTIEKAFLISPLPDGIESHLTLEKIGEIQDVPIISKDFLNKKSTKPLSIAGLSQYPIIFVSEENSVRKFFDQWFLSENLIFHPQYTVPHMSLVLSLVKQGLGVGFIPFNYVENEIKSGELIQLKTATLPKHRDVFIATIK